MYLGIYLAPTSVSWSTFYHGRYCSHIYDMPPANLHTAQGMHQALSFLEQRMLPEVSESVSDCVLTMPYISLMDRVHAEKSMRSLRLFSECRLRCVSCVSAASMALVDRRMESDGEDDYSLVLCCSGSEYEAAFVDIGDGIVIMTAVQQWTVPEGQEPDQESLKENIGHLIDHSDVKRFFRIYVQDSVDARMRAWLQAFYGVPCEVAESGAPLYGAALIAARICGSGFAQDLLLLDCTGYQVRIGTETLMDRGTTIPCMNSSRIAYNAARPDKCVDLYFFRNAKTEAPIYIKPSIAELIRESRGNIPLIITLEVDREGRPALQVSREQDGIGLEFDWPVLRRMLLDQE